MQLPCNVVAAGGTITDLVGDCSEHSLDLHFARACVKCKLECAATRALGRIICILCNLSSLSLIYPPCVLAAAAAATAMLRCFVAFSTQRPLHAAPLLLASQNTTPRPFDFVWKGNLSAEGVVQEGTLRVGPGFRDMMLALHEGNGDAVNASLLDVQVYSWPGANNTAHDMLRTCDSRSPLHLVQELFSSFEARASSGADGDVGVCACVLPRMAAWVDMQ